MSEVDISYILHKDAVAVVVSPSLRRKGVEADARKDRSCASLSLHHYTLLSLTVCPVSRSGIGLAAAKTFASKGMKVFLADINSSLLTTAVEQVSAIAKGAGGEVESLVVDVSDLSSVEALKDRVMESWGEVAILMNNVRFPLVSFFIRGTQS
jgi:hypothetical protein